MKIVIVGAGAVGVYFGGRLAATGQDVTFIARGVTLQKISSEGLKIHSISGDAYLREVRVTDQPDKAGEADVIILGIKAWQIPDMKDLLPPMMHSRTMILPLQNGIEACDQLVEYFGREHVLGGICRIVAFKTAPNEIHHTDVEPFIGLGELDNQKSDRILQLLNIILNSGIKAAVPDDIHSLIWQKFLFLAPAAGLGAVTRSSVGVLRSLPETRKMFIDAMKEIISLAEAKNVHLPSDILDKTLDFLDNRIGNSTSSMQRDIMEGKPSELESTNGAVVRLGKKLGIATPVHEFIYSCLLPMELEARKKTVKI